MKTALIIDDDEDILDMLEDFVSQSFNTVTAMNGYDGWQKYLQVKPSIIITDIKMPQMNGIELIKRIRLNDNTTIIAISGVDAKLLDQAREEGANHSILKPFGMDDLSDFIDQNETVKK